MESGAQKTPFNTVLLRQPLEPGLYTSPLSLPRGYPTFEVGASAPASLASCKRCASLERYIFGAHSERGTHYQVHSSAFDELAESAREGGRREREVLLQALRPVVCRWALVWTGSPDLSEDVAQEVLLRVSRSLLDSTPDAKLTTWVYCITRNVAVDVARRDGKDRDARNALRLHALTEASAPAADREMELRTATALLQRTMKSLSSQQRAAFDLVDVQGVSSADAADMLDIAPATLRVHLHRARQSLRALGEKESDV